MKLRDLIEGTGIDLVSGDGATVIAGLTDDSRRIAPGWLFIARPGTRHDGRQFVADAIERGAAAILCDEPDEQWGRKVAVLRARAISAAAAALSPCEPTMGATASAAQRSRLCECNPDDESATARPTAVAAAATSAGRGTPGSFQNVAAALAGRFFGDPSRKLRLIGITGTNGKTTTAYLIRQLLEHAGVRCGLMGTVEIDNGASRRPAELTTAGIIDVNRWLAEAVRNGCSAAVMEVSSHALAQGRTAGLRFEAAIFTNLSGDHLDYHGSMEEYAAAKSLLFAGLEPAATAVVNFDDAYGPAMLHDCRAGVIRCSMRDGHGMGPASTTASAAASARIFEMTASFTRAEFAGPWGRFEAALPLVGAHNVANALQALCACAALRVPFAALREGLTCVAAPPGRLEPVTGAEDEFAVLVDYAHSDGALDNVLAALRPLVPARGRLVTVFGCGGDRDRTKRPRMARVACAHSDRVIITSDNPRTEDPLAIIEEIMRGVPGRGGAAVTCLPDRRSAIAEAVAEARAGDVILIAGKGHEDYQIVGTRKEPFDDRVVAREALRARRGALIAA